MSHPPDPIHIAHVIIGLGQGGAEMMLRRLIEAQMSLGASVRHSVISLTTLGVHGQPLRDAGIAVHALGLSNILGAPGALVRLLRLLRQLQPDLVQTWMYHADLLGGWAAHWLGLPVIWGIHSFDLRQGSSRSTRWVQRLCAWSSRRVPSRILCVAESSKRLHAELGYDAARITVIPNGFQVDVPAVPAEVVLALRRSLGVADHEVLIGCVGRFNPAKDHHNFVEAAARVARLQPAARFLMVGSGLVEGNPELDAWIDASGCAPSRFIRLGERSDVPQLLAAMDIFCSSSRTEAFPLVVGEAMVMARAAVVTDVGDTAVLVGDAAVVVPPRDPQALADGLESLLTAGSQTRVRLGQQARQRVIDQFSMARLIERTERVWAEVLDRTSPPDAV